MRIHKGLRSLDVKTRLSWNRARDANSPLSLGGRLPLLRIRSRKLPKKRSRHFDTDAHCGKCCPRVHRDAVDVLPEVSKAVARRNEGVAVSSNVSCDGAAVS